MRELTTTVTTLTTKLEASLGQLEATKEELAAERRKFAFLSQVLETTAARLRYREKEKWRRALFLLLTVVLSAAIGAATFGVFLWLYYRGIIALG